MKTFTEIVDTTVKDLDQTFKKCIEDGKFTEDEKIEIKNMAVNRINTQMPVFLKTHLNKAVNDLDSFIGSKIEATVRDMKCEIK